MVRDVEAGEVPGGVRLREATLLGRLVSAQEIPLKQDLVEGRLIQIWVPEWN